MTDDINKIMNQLEEVFTDEDISMYRVYNDDMMIEEAIKLALHDSLCVLPEDITYFLLRIMRFSYIMAKEDVPFNEVFRGIIDAGMH